ncbi:MAG: septal ring lytic transglycosylase RlpA family protein [Sphingomonadaceae bacterium]
MRCADFAALALVALLAACARPAPGPVATPPAAPAQATAPAGVKLGRPYQVFGRTYVPADDRAYDEVGIASWYGPGFHGAPTANGERYDQDELTAAHRTLPMPSWVEVHNLDNGRRLVVRVNDRGPFVDGRIIDLSRRSAQLLGVDGPGLARVRVRRVYPEGDWARVTPPLAPGAAPVRQARAEPPRQEATEPARPASAMFVQVAALSDAGRAQFLASDLGDIAPGLTQPAPNGLWRVRLGPFATEAEALRALEGARSRGFADARIVRS